MIIRHASAKISRINSWGYSIVNGSGGECSYLVSLSQQSDHRAPVWFFDVDQDVS